MKYGLTASPTLTSSDCLVIGIFSDCHLPDFAQLIDKQTQGLITRLTQKMQEAGDIAWQSDIDGQQLLMIHCGHKAKFSTQQLELRVSELTTLLLKQRIQTATICLPHLTQRSADWQVQFMLLQLEKTRYQFLSLKSNHPEPHALDSVLFFLPAASDKSIEAAEAIASGIHLTATLANLPANICTPSYLAKQAQQLSTEHAAITTNTLDAEEMRALGMGSLLAVSQGSIEPPQLVEIRYAGQSDKPPIVLVGKGITFDSGGLSLKPADSMAEMKYDMCGAATVFGVLKASALLKLPLNIIGLVACAENLPSGTAVKPGDVVTSMSGQTIEIINTDAEGRLVLADALTYAERYNPHFVIDIATLTGAMVVALGNVHTGIMTPDDELAQLIETAAKDSGDTAWRLPMDTAYQEALESPIADMVNATFDRSAGAIVAACFLSRFTKSYRWAHLDIAGTAYISGKKRQATGRPVPLLIQLLRHVAYSR